VLRDVIFTGGNLHEAEDALSLAMTEVFQRWDTITNPRAYARRAAISNLIKIKQRGLARIRDRLVEQGDFPPAQDQPAGKQAGLHSTLGEAAPRITTLHPRTYNDARAIGEHFREGTEDKAQIAERGFR
jgi:hypothetical protein